MKNNQVKTIFVGTPDFGIPLLISLINNKNFNISAVITQPDKKVGRKQSISEPPIKKIARSYDLQVMQPEKLKDFVDEIKTINPDLIIVIAYAQILPQAILEIPKYGCINIHGSLLPKYRGATCIQAAILNNDNETGITIIKMDEGLDTGPIIAQKKVEISRVDTTEKLFNKLSGLAGKVAVPLILEYVKGNILPIPQDNSKSSKTKILNKDDGKIDWRKAAEENERFVRAMYSWPLAFTQFENKRLQIIKAETKILAINDFEIGEVFLSNGKIAVQCGQNALALEIVKLEGKPEMLIKEFVKGRKDFVGSMLR